MTPNFDHWLTAVSGPGWRWCLKVLSANDTGATGNNQAGPYIPNEIIFSFFPSLAYSTSSVLDTTCDGFIDSHGVSDLSLRAVWYKSKNEARITRWGGRRSPLLDAENTGDLCVLAFYQAEPSDDATECRVWICGLDESDQLSQQLGEVAPRVAVLYDPQKATAEDIPDKEYSSPCKLRPDEIPAEWQREFPDASAMVELAVSRLPAANSYPVDERLVHRHRCEYGIFRSIEAVSVMPRVRESFATVDSFLQYASSVMNRRKARAGRSLELHTQLVLTEEGVAHSYNKVTEGKRRPDFIFPSIEAYRDPTFPTKNLRMLAVKTTCKDRWRQVVDEAARIAHIHLLTLQEGVSADQFKQMKDNRVSLVVPRPLHRAYPASVRPQLLSIEQFLDSATQLGP